LYSPSNFGQALFGFKPGEDEVNDLLHGLQKIVNYLVPETFIDVRCYTRAAKLMHKIMYEFGCFEGVMESSGEKNRAVRDSLIFPKPRYKYSHLSNGPYFYIDMNSAYPSCMTGIPLTLEPDSKVNTKIKDLIETMYYVVTRLKKLGDDKLAKTVKGLMNVSYGDSYRKAKNFTTKPSSNVKSRVNEVYPYVAKYQFNADNKTGFVTTINSFRPHFNHVQFAKLILDNYHEKVKELEKLVKILFYNVDAFIINESDYLKLRDLGYIGDGLGQFKIEAIFDEVYFEGPRKFMAKMECGDVFCRPRKLIEKMMFEEFKNNVIN
jgi:hypothetical protein